MGFFNYLFFSPGSGGMRTGIREGQGQMCEVSNEKCKLAVYVINRKNGNVCTETGVTKMRMVSLNGL